MVRLIHLNGPSRVGKSTLARRYVAVHPSSLNLDLDVLVGLIGAWEQDFPRALEVAKGYGTSLARICVQSGGEVVLPQLVTVFDGTPWGQVLADAVGAEYVEIALTIDPEAHDARIQEKTPHSAVELHLQRQLVDARTSLFENIRRDFASYLEQRPHAFQIDTTFLTPDETYERIRSLLGG